MARTGFRQKGYLDLGANKRMCVTLINRFNAMLAGLAGTPPFAHVKYLDLRNTLPTGPNYKTYWDNELHPTKRGFDAVTKKFADAI